MAAPTTTIELLDQVVALGLCDSSKLTGTFPAENPLPDSPSEVVAQLVRYGVCTKYQARMLLAGKGRKLLLGKYLLLRPLGKGGGGSVFLGEHADLRRRVAVKVLRGGSSADNLTVERFKREARAAAALDHPNLVRLFDFGVSHGVPYLVMEYAAGKTLQQLLDAGGPLAVPAAVYVATQTAIGLGHAHTRGIVHRDVKPLNLMVSAEGQVKILDMGLARALDRIEDRLTEQADQGTVAGTIDYMPPEQCSGLGADERTDIYALGATLFTLLSGRAVFLGTPAEKIAQHQTAVPPVLDQVAPNVPPGLARVVERMLAKRPMDRFVSCDEVIAAFAPWCPSEPPSLGVTDLQRTTSLRTGRKSSVNWSAGEARRKIARNWRWAALVLGILVAFGGAVGLAFALTPRPTPVVDAPDADLQLSGNWSNVNELVFTADGTRLLGVDWSGGLCVWDTATGTLVDRLKVGNPDATGNHLSFMPDGRVLVCGARMPTTLWDLEKRELAFTYEYRTDETWSVVPSPDGKTVLVEGSADVALRDAKTGDLLRTFDAGLEFVWYSTFSRDGKLVAAAGRVNEEKAIGTVAVWETDTGKLVHLLTCSDGDARWVAFSPDGTKLASCGFDSSIRVWNLSTGKCEKTFTDANVFVERVQFLENGRILSVAACDWSMPEPYTSTVCVWDLTSPEATPVWSRTLPGRANSVAYSPATGLLSVANKSRQVWLTKAPPEMSGK